MGDVVVAENEFFRAAVPDTLYHWGVIACVRVDLTTCTARGGGGHLRKWESESKCTWLFPLRWSCIPGSILARVKRVESLATKQEVKSRAASLLWRSASSFSSSTWNLLVPEMFLVPPAPDPCFRKVSLEVEEKHKQVQSQRTSGEYYPAQDHPNI